MTTYARYLIKIQRNGPTCITYLSVKKNKNLTDRTGTKKGFRDAFLIFSDNLAFTILLSVKTAKGGRCIALFAVSRNP